MFWSTTNEHKTYHNFSLTKMPTWGSLQQNETIKCKNEKLIMKSIKCEGKTFQRIRGLSASHLMAVKSDRAFISSLQCHRPFISIGKNVQDFQTNLKGDNHLENLEGRYYLEKSPNGSRQMKMPNPNTPAVAGFGRWRLILWRQHQISK